jgi:hypothetical protein
MDYGEKALNKLLNHIEQMTISEYEELYDRTKIKFSECFGDTDQNIEGDKILWKK